MWVATMTRPDIASAVREVAKFSDKPGRAHWKAVRRILQYIARTKDRGITYGGQKAEIEMTASADSDHATCLDTRRSVSGGAVLLGGARSAGSPGHRVTATGTSESEYVALCHEQNRSCKYCGAVTWK